VDLYGRRSGTTVWVKVGSAVATSTGALSFVDHPTSTMDYRWEYFGGTAYMGSVSAARTVTVT
jgi:hypothetical protein